jgi:hypothetical protein
MAAASSASSTKHNDGGRRRDSGGGGGGTICHILPCSIDQDITAPIAQYFHPTPLLTSPKGQMQQQQPKKKDGTTSSSNVGDDGIKVMAAQFRGRGLLCVVETPTPPPSSLLSVSQALETTVCTKISNVKNYHSDPSTELLPLCNDADKQQRCANTLSKLPSNIMGVVLSPSSSNTSAATTNNHHHLSSSYHGTTTNTIPDTTIPKNNMQSLKTIETFDHVYNWQHEHDVQKVITMNEQDHHDKKKYGLSAALEWCDLAKSIHDPIPVNVVVIPPPP